MVGVSPKRLIEPLRLHRGEPGAEAANAWIFGVPVDEPTQLGHGPARITETAIVEVDQSESDAQVVAGRELGALKPLELHHCGLGLLQDTRGPFKLITDL